MDSTTLSSLYRLEPAPRVRRFHASIDPAAGVVVVRVPKAAAQEEIDAYLARHADWARAALNRLPRAVPFASGAILPLFGVTHRVAVVGDDNGGGGMPVLVAAAGDAVSVREAVERHAQEWFAAEVARMAAVLGCTPGPVVVADMTEAWGTCHRDGTITLSWRLAFARRPAVAGYIVAHEVAHLVAFNHDGAFWATCGTITPMPACDAIKWLKRFGSELRRYGAPR